MTDRLDELLKRLPNESVAADLVTRIALTVAARRAAAQRLRGVIGISLTISSVLGLIFLIADLPGLLNSVIEIFVLLQINLFDLSNGLNTLLTSSSESFGAALVLGLTFLLLATIGGLVQLLNTPTQSMSR